MRDGNILLLTGAEAQAILAGREQEIVDAVARAYQTHGRGNSSLPHSIFLHFPRQPRDRIIALPACLEEDFQVAGIKWIASFPGNEEMQYDRASAVVILNSIRTGRPEAILEGSIISAKRTAASAALAASLLCAGRPPATTGLIGCGPINFEIALFLLSILPAPERILLYDHVSCKAEQFGRRLRQRFPGLQVAAAATPLALLRACTLVSLATTASTPHIPELGMCPDGTTILHISLRDLSPEAILASDNIVDDIDHVFRAGTSIELAGQLTGNRGFVRGTLYDILAGRIPPRRESGGITVFSPFGLGVLDLAVAKLAADKAHETTMGTTVRGFLPQPWHQADPESSR